MKIALYFRHIDAADRVAYDELVSTLQRRGIDTVTVADGDSVDGCDFLFSIGGELIGYTSTTVSIRDGSFIRIYDSTGTHKFTR